MRLFVHRPQQGTVKVMLCRQHQLLGPHSAVQGDACNLGGGKSLEANGGIGWHGLTNQTAQVVQTGWHLRQGEGQVSGEQLKQQDAQRVNVTRRVDLAAIRLLQR